MEITFLGTGTSQGVPEIATDDPIAQSTDHKDKRLRCSALISWDNININIDCGPDFRQQMITNNVKHLEAILFTHEHADHTAGLDDIRPFVFRQHFNMPIYANKRVIQNLKTRFAYIFETENKYPGAPSVEEHIVEDEPFYIHNKKIIPIQILHGNLPILAYRIDDLVYITDAKTIPENQFEKLKNVDTLVINCLRIEPPHMTHLILNEAIELIQKIKPKRTFLTHISQAFGFHKNIEKLLPKNIFLAYDNLKINI